MAGPYDDLIEAFSDSAVQRISETVKGIIAASPIAIIRVWGLEYNDNDYYLDSANNIGFVIGEQEAKRVVRERLESYYHNNISDRAWRYIEDDDNYTRRHAIASKVSTSPDDVWGIELHAIKDHCDRHDLDFWSDYMPPVVDYRLVEPLQ